MLVRDHITVKAILPALLVVKIMDQVPPSVRQAKLNVVVLRTIILTRNFVVERVVYLLRFYRLIKISRTTYKIFTYVMKNHGEHRVAVLVRLSTILTKIVTTI